MGRANIEKRERRERIQTGLEQPEVRNIVRNWEVL
jgi:hypothetical protein